MGPSSGANPYRDGGPTRGAIQRIANTGPGRVQLTELGQTICDPVHAIRDWAEKHAGELRAARQRYDRPEAPRGGSSPD